RVRPLSGDTPLRRAQPRRRARRRRRPRARARARPRGGALHPRRRRPLTRRGVRADRRGSRATPPAPTPALRSRTGAGTAPGPRNTEGGGAGRRAGVVPARKGGARPRLQARAPRARDRAGGRGGPGSRQMSHDRRYLVLTAMIFAVAMMFVDQTIVAIAVPYIQRGLALSATGLQWVVNGYLLALAALFALGGKGSDGFGHRRVVIMRTIGRAG